MISDNYAPIHQIGNGVTTQFSASWSMLSAAFAQVFLEDVTTGVQTPVTQGTAANQYQITINASGFIVTFNTAPTSAYYAVIGRSVPATQSTPYSTSTGFQGKVEENSFDKLTALVQDGRDAVDRAIKAPLGDNNTVLDLPVPSVRANTVLGFDAFGNVTAFTTLPVGSVSAAMAPVVSAATLAAARTAFSVPSVADALNIAASYGCGFKNKFRNSSFEVWKRGLTINVAPGSAYTADGWIVTATGGTVAVTRDAGQNDTWRALKVTGAASVTNVTIKQRIDSLLSANLDTKQITIQALIRNDTGASITPTLAVNYANAQDNFAAVTQELAATNLQPCPDASWTRVAYSFLTSDLVGNGLEIIFGLGNNFPTAGDSARIAEVDIRETPYMATGLVASPPDAEPMPSALDLQFNALYYETSYSPNVAPGTVTTAGQLLWQNVAAYDYPATAFFKSPKRTVPTIVIYSPNSGTANRIYGNGGLGDSAGFNVIAAANGFNIMSTGGPGSQYISCHWTASSEL